MWPFPTKDIATQSRRTDEGWDLQYSGSQSVPIYAVESGTLRTAGPDPNGFGQSYPLLVLDSPALGQYPAIYYGHTFPDPFKVGKHVDAGEEIGHTGGAHSGGNAYLDPNWLEIGFWENGPVGNGTVMKQWLSGGAVGPGGGWGGGGGGTLAGCVPGATMLLAIATLYRNFRLTYPSTRKSRVSSPHGDNTKPGGE